MKRLLQSAVLLVLLPVMWRVNSVDAALSQDHATTQDQKAAAPKATAVDKSADYLGSETCLACHEDVTNKFSETPHSRLALMHGGKGATCESCHGPGKAHVESGGDVSKIFQFSKATPRQVDQKCQSCHVAVHPNFERTAHGLAQISCTNCHSAHKFVSETMMLKAKEPTLCYQCHTDAKAAFAQPFHHKVDEGLLKCSDCHNAHGTFQPDLVRISATQDAICTKCHVETLGPFVYEHPPIKTEGCTSCHSPHGSPNSRLLIRNNVNSLCMQCHRPSEFTAPGIPSFHNQANQYQACTVCHVQIHGSNASSVFFK